MGMEIGALSSIKLIASSAVTADGGGFFVSLSIDTPFLNGRLFFLPDAAVVVLLFHVVSRFFFFLRRSFPASRQRGEREKRTL
jgi:hypothetical protein